MRISMIAALAKNRVIGCNNDLPWYLPADMRYFKKTTMGKPIIMGRKTFESFGSKPLPGRPNIILSRSENYLAADCLIFTSAEATIAALKKHEEIMIIGGASIYEQFLPKAQRLYLTLIDAEFKGDSYFPDYEHDTWQQTSRASFDKDDKNPYAYSFVVLDRDSG